MTVDPRLHVPRSPVLGLMSVARTGLPHRDRTETAEDRSGGRDATAADCSRVTVVAAADGSLAARPQLPAPDPSAAAGNGSVPPRDSRTRVREVVAHERATGTRLRAHEVAAAVGISQRRAYELLRALRAEDQQP